LNNIYVIFTEKDLKMIKNSIFKREHFHVQRFLILYRFLEYVTIPQILNQIRIV